MEEQLNKLLLRKKPTVIELQHIETLRRQLLRKSKTKGTKVVQPSEPIQTPNARRDIRGFFKSENTRLSMSFQQFLLRHGIYPGLTESRVLQYTRTKSFSLDTLSYLREPIVKQNDFNDVADFVERYDIADQVIKPDVTFRRALVNARIQRGFVDQNVSDTQSEDVKLQSEQDRNVEPMTREPEHQQGESSVSAMVQSSTKAQLTRTGKATKRPVRLEKMTPVREEPTSSVPDVVESGEQSLSKTGNDLQSPRPMSIVSTPTEFIRHDEEPEVQDAPENVDFIQRKMESDSHLKDDPDQPSESSESDEDDAEASAQQEVQPEDVKITTSEDLTQRAKDLKQQQYRDYRLSEGMNSLPDRFKNIHGEELTEREDRILKGIILRNFDSDQSQIDYQQLKKVPIPGDQYDEYRDLATTNMEDKEAWRQLVQKNLDNCIRLLDSAIYGVEQYKGVKRSERVIRAIQYDFEIRAIDRIKEFYFDDNDDEWFFFQVMRDDQSQNFLFFFSFQLMREVFCFE